MKLRLPLLAALLVLMSSAVIGVAPATAFDPKTDDYEIVHLADLDTFSYEMRREFTGAAGQRVYAVYQDSFQDVEGFIPAKYPTNGRFVLDWIGDVELPDRFVQQLTIGNNDWTEWSVNGKAKGRYNDALINNLSERRNEALFWWQNVSEWLDAYGDALTCETATKIVNDEQAVRCTAPSLTLTEKIRLIETVGMFSDDETKSVSTFNFELWLTKSDSIPVRMDLSASAVDAKNNAFGGRFTLDIFDIDSDEISIALPR